MTSFREIYFKVQYSSSNIAIFGKTFSFLIFAGMGADLHKKAEETPPFIHSFLSPPLRSRPFSPGGRIRVLIFL